MEKESFEEKYEKKSWGQEHNFFMSQIPSKSHILGNRSPAQ